MVLSRKALAERGRHAGHLRVALPLRDAAAVERLRASSVLVHPGHAWLAKLGGSDATEEPGEEAPTR